MQLNEAQSREMLRTHGVYLTEACDECGTLIHYANRFTRKGEPGVWCSRLCRDGVERRASVRRKKASRQPVTTSGAGRLCRNPRCTRGDDGGPGSLTHLRADALYCDDTCKKAGQRSPNRQNRPSNRQYLCGSKGDKFGSLAHPYQPEQCLAQNARNRNHGLQTVRAEFERLQRGPNYGLNKAVAKLVEITEARETKLNGKPQ
jgi:hypothetical protein